MNLIFEDNHLLVVEKPAGVPVQADKSGDTNLLDQGRKYLAKKYQKKGNVYLGLVHRLDRPVSGVVIFAKTSKAASRLSEQFRNGQIQKTYWALVAGQWTQEEGNLVHYLAPGPQNKVKVFDTEKPKSKKSQLKFRVLSRIHISFPETTLLEIEPLTGRKHQIRAQLAHIGYPIVGDRKYGCRIPLKSRRIALLAKALKISHPITKEQTVFEVYVDKHWPQNPKSSQRT
jgi:23S rRNA pseudouridine1911/1915/1917 synthase